MPIDVHSSQETLLKRGSIAPIVLVDVTSTSGTLRFCTERAISYLGHLYQPYVATAGTLRTAANFPENNTSSQSFQLQFNNSPIEYQGQVYDYLSQIFYPVFPWELADVEVRVLLTSGTSDLPAFSEDVAMRWVASGIAGAPTSIDREKFIVPVYTRNFKLNDQIPMRAVTRLEFPEADRDELDGKTYLPIVVGSGVRVRARATGAGATTTITEEVSAGSKLKVSEVDGFEAGDSIIINGFINNPFTIGAVDSVGKRFVAVSPNLNTLGTTITAGTAVREDKAAYDYTVANHQCVAIREVRVTPHGGGDPTVISGSQFQMVSVPDPRAIGGIRTDARINQLIPFGSESAGEVTQQPVATVDDGLHVHNTGVFSDSIQVTFAGATSGPPAHANANDGNEDTGVSVNTGTVGEDILTFSSFPGVNGVFSEQRYYAVMNGPLITGNVRIRRSGSTFLTLSAAFNKGEFRSTIDTGGSETSDFEIVVQTDPTQVNVWEAWKEVTHTPLVSEDTKDLRFTTRTADVAIDVSGANIEVGDLVEAVVDGVPVPDNSGLFGSPTASGTAIQRPDAVARWLLTRALGQTEAVIDVATYSGSGAAYDANGIRLAFAVDHPTKLDALLDQIADNSESMHWWGREGHALRYLDTPASTHSFVEDQSGVISIDWQNTHQAADIRNSPTAYFGRDWVESAGNTSSYAGSVTAGDADSQARFGVLGNEVDSGGRSLFLEMTTTSGQAQNVLNRILADKANPKKQFTDDTDWSYVNIQPGDVIVHSSPTISSPVTARVIENTVDPRLFCRIVAKEITQPPARVAEAEAGSGGAFHAKSVQLYDSVGSKFADNTHRDVGIANAFTIFMRFKLTQAQTKSLLVIKEVGPASNKSAIILRQESSPAGNIEATVLRDSDGGFGIRRNYNGAALTDGSWQELFFTWDGSDIALYTGLTGASTLRSVSSTESAVGGALASRNRGILSDTGVVGYYYNLAIWNVVLSSSSRTAVSQNVQVDLTENFGNYTDASSLKCYFLFDGDKSTCINFGSAGGFDLFADAGEIVGSTDTPT